RVVGHGRRRLHFLQERVERLLLIRQLYVCLVRLWLCCRISLIHARLVQRNLSINRLHFEHGRLTSWSQSQVSCRETRLIKIKAEQAMERERQHQSQKKPVALAGRI